MPNNIHYLFNSNFLKPQSQLPELCGCSDLLDWFDPIIINQKNNHSKLKTYRAEIWLTDCDYACIDVYAPTKKIAYEYLNEQFCLIDLHCHPSNNDE